MKKKLLIVAVMLVLSAALVLNARPGLRGMGQGRGQQGRDLFPRQNFIPARMLLKAKDKIGLSVEQEKRIIALNEAHEQWTIKFRADMEIKALKLRANLEGEQVNLNDAEGLIREQADMHAEMAIARLRFQQDIKALLTPEQLVKISELKKEFRGQERDGMRQQSGRRQDRRD
jgi:Spy/CpxP family protein refolding chaperone